MRTTTNIIATAILTLSACSTANDRSKADGWSVTDSAGVTIVLNTRDSVPYGCVTIEVQPDVTIPRIGSRDKTTPDLYGVTGGAVLRDGEIVLLNSGTQQLLFFAPDGTYERATGGPGRGPGEFMSPSWLGRSDGETGSDTLFVWDDRLARLSTFNGTGEFLESHQVGGNPMSGPPAPAGRFSDGSFLVIPGPLMFIGETKGVTRFKEVYQRYDPGTNQTRKLAVGRSSEIVAGMGPVYSLPFGKRTWTLASGDALLVADNGEAEMRFYDMEGGLSRVVRWESPPQPVTDEDKRHYEQQAAAQRRPGAPKQLSMQFAAARPRFSSIYRDWEGWFWVRTFAPAWEPPGDWLLFNPDGRLECRAESPARMGMLEVARDYLLAVQRNELDEESVVRYRVERR